MDNIEKAKLLSAMGLMQSDLDRIVSAYTSALLWSSHVFISRKGDDETYEGADEFEPSNDFHVAAVDTCLDFLSYLNSIGVSFGAALCEQFGHDYALTRNGHGVGFWARPVLYGETAAKQLTDAAKTMGEADVYLNDANEVEHG